MYVNAFGITQNYGLAVLIWIYHNAVSLQTMHSYCEAALWCMRNFFVRLFYVPFFIRLSWSNFLYAKRRRYWGKHV
jgi:hypothetical protein